MRLPICTIVAVASRREGVRVRISTCAPGLGSTSKRLPEEADEALRVRGGDLENRLTGEERFARAVMQERDDAVDRREQRDGAELGFGEAQLALLDLERGPEGLLGGGQLTAGGGIETAQGGIEAGDELVLSVDLLAERSTRGTGFVESLVADDG